MRKLVMLCSLCGEQSDIREQDSHGIEEVHRAAVSWGGSGDNLATRIGVRIDVVLEPQNERYNTGHFVPMNGVDVCAECRNLVQQRAFGEMLEKLKAVLK
jgi:hypothetical protein